MTAKRGNREVLSEPTGSDTERYGNATEARRKAEPGSRRRREEQRADVAGGSELDRENWCIRSTESCVQVKRSGLISAHQNLIFKTVSDRKEFSLIQISHAQRYAEWIFPLKYVQNTHKPSANRPPKSRAFGGPQAVQVQVISSVRRIGLLPTTGERNEHGVLSWLRKGNSRNGAYVPTLRSAARQHSNIIAAKT